MLEFLTTLCQPWAKWYGDHSWAGIVVTFPHIAGLVWGGGRAMAADRLVLRSKDPDGFAIDGLEFLRGSHRDVLIGLSAVVLSGLLLFASDVEHFWGTPVYWTKMALFVTLLINGAMFNRLEAAIDTGGAAATSAWKRLRRHSMISLSLWLTVTLLGVVLING